MTAGEPNLFPSRAERGYDREAVEAFPWPIVAGYDDVHRWMDADLSVYAAWQLRDCWEGLLKFLATLAAADHLSAAEPGDPRTSKLLAPLLFSRGISLGHWAGVLRTALADGTPAGVRLPELGPVFFDRRGKPTPFLRSLAEGPESFIAWRNHRFGHGVFGQDQGAFADEATIWLQRLHEAYDAARPVLTEISLESDDPVGGPLTWGSVSPLTFYHAHQPADHAEALLPVRVQVHGRAIELTPLLSVQQCQVCGQWATFYLDRYRDDQQRAWFLDFLNGHPRERRQLAVLGEWAGKVSDEDRRAASSGAAGLPEPDPERFRDFQAEFEPPVYLAEQAASFILNHDRGVLFVTGPAGVGKSWLCEGLDHSAMLPAVLGTKVETLRLSLHGGRTWTAGEVQAELREQARKVKRWPAPNEVDGPTPSARWSAWLAALMQQACLGRLIVALDGLDELPAESDVPGLFPPANELPRGCYLVLASRPENKATVAAGLKRVRSAESYVADIAIGLASAEHRAVLLHYAEKQLRQSRRDRSEGLPTEWAQALVDRAEGRFLYVFHYCRALKYGVYADVSALPAPADYYPHFFASLRDCVGAELFESYYAKTLAIIAAAREPIGLGLMTACGLERGRLVSVLADLADLLHARREPWDEETLYSLGHDAIREFLREDADWARRVEEAHRFLAELVVRRFADDWSKADPFDSIESYLLFHVLSHAIDPDVRESLLTDASLGTSCSQHSKALLEQARYATSIKAAEMALAIWAELVDQRGRLDLEPHMASTSANYASGLSMISRPHEALSAATSATQRFSELVQRKGRKDLRLQLSIALLIRGRILTDLDSGAASNVITDGVSLLEELVQREGQRELRPQLAEAHATRARALRRAERHEESLIDANVAVGLLRDLVYSERQHEYCWMLAAADMAQGEALAFVGRNEEWLESAYAAVGASSDLVENQGQLTLRSLLAGSWLTLGKAQFANDNYIEALSAFRAAESIYVELLYQEGRREVAADYAWNSTSLAILLLFLEESGAMPNTRDQARKLLGEAVHLLRTEVERVPSANLAFRLSTAEDFNRWANQ